MNYKADFKTLEASADFLGNGAIETNRYESEITDMVRRDSVFLQRVKRIKATGHPHRYFEQTLIATGSFTDPRTIAPSPTSPTRVERAAMIKAITAQTNMSLFDVEVTKMQGQFAGLEAKDIEDITSACLLTAAPAIWIGTDTSLSTPTTTQYVGLLTQITQQAVIAPGASIVDGLKAEVAVMNARTDFKVKPTGIYISPILSDLIDRESKAQHIDLKTVEVVAGVHVKAISTVVGDLPLINDPWLAPFVGAQFGFAAPPVGNKTYAAVITTESEIEMPHVTGADGGFNPRIFQLGLTSNLAGQYVAIWFNNVIAKGFSYAHAVVAVQRP